MNLSPVTRCHPFFLTFLPYARARAVVSISKTGDTGDTGDTVDTVRFFATNCIKVRHKKWDCRKSGQCEQVDGVRSSLSAQVSAQGPKGL